MREVLNLGDQPLCDDLIPFESSRVAQKYPTVIIFCDSCLTAHQRYQIPKTALFPSSYHYRSGLTADVTSGMKELVASVRNFAGNLRGAKVVDIGCNDGSLLDFFHDAGSVTLGVEPTDAALEVSREKHIVHKEFFDSTLAQTIKDEFGSPDVVTFTNVFAHIEDLPGLVEALRILMGKGSLLVIENHYLGAVLRGKQFDTFYHEHPRTYSATSLNRIADSLGRSLLKVDFPSRYGGNIRVFIGESGGGPESATEVETVLQKEKSIGAEINDLQGFVSNWISAKRDEIKELVNVYGPLPSKAFPGRASILITLLGLTSNEIAAIYEKPDSPKIGHTVPGSDIPILSDSVLIESLPQIPVVLNFAWHIRSEIEVYLTVRGFQGTLVDIIDA